MNCSPGAARSVTFSPHMKITASWLLVVALGACSTKPSASGQSAGGTSGSSSGASGGSSSGASGGSSSGASGGSSSGASGGSSSGASGGASAGSTGSTPSLTLSVSLTGLASNSNVIFQNNGGDDLSISTSSGTFATALASGSHYVVTVKTQPRYDAGASGSHNQTCVVANASGVATANASLNVTCHTNVVSPLYPAHGGNWLDYVANDAGVPADTTSFNTNGTTSFGAQDVACSTGDTTIIDYYSCLHGGEYRVFTVYGVSDCSGLTAADDVGTSGAFAWQCLPTDASHSDVRFASWHLRPGAGLADLIDFQAQAFIAITVSVTNAASNVILRSDPVAPWWNNTFATAGSIVSGIQTNTIFTVNGGLDLSAPIDLSPHQALVTSRVPSADVFTTSAIAHLVSTSEFDWVEGAFAAGTTTAYALVTGGAFGVLNDIYLDDTTVDSAHTRQAAIFVSTSFGSFRQVFLDFGPAVSGYGLGLFGAHANRFSGIHVSGGGGSISGNNYSVSVGSNTSGDLWNDLRIFDSFGIESGASNESLTDLIIAGCNEVYFPSLSNAWVSGMTSINGVDGLFVDNSSNNTFLQTAIVNNQDGLDVYDSSAGNAFVNVAILGNTTDVHYNNTANSFANTKIGTSGCAPSCPATGTSSGFTVAGAFVGAAVLDGVNPTAGAAASGTNYNGVSNAAISNWFSFANDYRGWGQDLVGSAFPTLASRGVCKGDGSVTCDIWDYSLRTADALDTGGNPLLNTQSAPTGATAFVQNWYASGANALAQAASCALIPGADWDGVSACTSTYLPSAVEISDDGVGNDNGLCEAGEYCLFTPNIGAYQGKGASSCVSGTYPACNPIVFNGGTVVLLKLSQNGE